MTLRAALAVSLAALLVTCVPATEEVAPRGAAGAIIEPSPASRGEPFVTPDGWTIRVEQLAVAGMLSVRPVRAEDHYGGSTLLFWNGASSARSYVPALPVGAYRVAMEVDGVYVTSVVDDRIRSGTAPEVAGLEPDLARRFTQPADDVETSADDPAFVWGPAVVLVARAERAGEVVMLDLALEGQSDIGSIPVDVVGVPVTTGASVDVRANAVAFATMRLVVERLFQTRDGVFAPFQVIADADRAGDRDGRVTGRELRSRPSEPEGCPEGKESGPEDAGQSKPLPVEDDPCASPLGRLAVRVARLIEHDEHDE